jgi:hypothetical protein
VGNARSTGGLCAACAHRFNSIMNSNSLQYDTKGRCGLYDPRRPSIFGSDGFYKTKRFLQNAISLGIK